MKKIIMIVILITTFIYISVGFSAITNANENDEISQEALINSQGAALYDYVCSLSDDGSFPEFWAGGAIIDNYTNMEIFVTCDPEEVRDSIISVTGNKYIKITQVEYSYNFLLETKDWVSDKISEFYENFSDNPEIKELRFNTPVIGCDVISNCLTVFVLSSANCDYIADLFKKYIINAPYLKFKLLEDLFEDEILDEKNKNNESNYRKKA